MARTVITRQPIQAKWMHTSSQLHQSLQCCKHEQQHKRTVINTHRVVVTRRRATDKRIDIPFISSFIFKSRDEVPLLVVVCFHLIRFKVTTMFFIPLTSSFIAASVVLMLR